VDENSIFLDNITIILGIPNYIMVYKQQVVQTHTTAGSVIGYHLCLYKYCFLKRQNIILDMITIVLFMLYFINFK